MLPSPRINKSRSHGLGSSSTRVNILLLNLHFRVQLFSHISVPTPSIQLLRLPYSHPVGYLDGNIAMKGHRTQLTAEAAPFGH